jgi:hypothetical protein
LVALDSDRRQNCRDLLAGRGNLHFAAFDALWVKGKDLRERVLKGLADLGWNGHVKWSSAT